MTLARKVASSVRGIHQQDPFARDYMRAVGHFDFGLNLAPINFSGWLDKRRTQDENEFDFWVEYWIAAYSFLLSQDEGLLFFSYEQFCVDPSAHLSRISERLELAPFNWIEPTQNIREPRKRGDQLKSVFEAEALSVWNSLREKSI